MITYTDPNSHMCPAPQDRTDDIIKAIKETRRTSESAEGRSRPPDVDHVLTSRVYSEEHFNTIKLFYEAQVVALMGLVTSLNVGVTQQTRLIHTLLSVLTVTVMEPADYSKPDAYSSLKPCEKVVIERGMVPGIPPEADSWELRVAPGSLIWLMQRQRGGDGPVLQKISKVVSVLFNVLTQVGSTCIL